MRRYRNAKIIATLGPVSSSKNKISELFEAGVDVFRLNFSHGNQADHQRKYNIIRSLETDYGRPVGVLLDLQGPKLRVGKFSGGAVALTAGQKFNLGVNMLCGSETGAPLPHPEIFKVLVPGTNLLIDDGKIKLEVERCSSEQAETKVIVGGLLSNHKGVNVPGAVLDISSLTEKDRDDLRFGLQIGIDWVGLSFVQRPEDVLELQKIISGRANVMAKIEKPQAMECLSEIISLSDGLMVARGDLGVECPPEEVPGLQKKVVRLCREAGKPVVVAVSCPPGCSRDSPIHLPQAEMRPSKVVLIT